jgi:hypothetical protein
LRAYPVHSEEHAEQRPGLIPQRSRPEHGFPGAFICIDNYLRLRKRVVINTGVTSHPLHRPTLSVHACEQAAHNDLRERALRVSGTRPIEPRHV